MIPLTSIYLEVARRVDGATLVSEALSSSPELVASGPVHVLAVGKVAFPMFEGLVGRFGADRIASGLLIAPETRFPVDAKLPPGVRGLVSDHPDASERSVAAGRAARELLMAIAPSDRLVVLLSGGASAAMSVPAAGLSLDEKRTTTKAVARAGASIAELNTVRKHLSAIKGGQLALATQAQTTVLTLSDVVGSDPGVIASGPFSPDATTFAQALALVQRLAPNAPTAVFEHLRRGVAGALTETPKPGDPRLGHVDYKLLAGPERVPEEAKRIIEREGSAAGTLSLNTEASVDDLALQYGKRARRESQSGGPPHVLIGNGEPSIVVRGDGRGGRATHLALLMAREIAGMPNIAFLAAGTDDRDGASDASGAIVDGSTWERAQSQGLDPAGALDRCDSEAPLKALGALVRGPGTSNLLDLHLLAMV
jgi:glycerate 2-kinase